MRSIFTILILSISWLGLSNDTLSLEEKINLLYEVNPNEQLEERAVKIVQEYCHYLKKFDRLAPKSRVKKVFSDIKKKHLYSYRLDTFFPDLFGRKTYNCVTGTALIAIIFDELSIPYSIVKVPNHVYLVAYPKTLKIGVESTNRKYGIYQWNDYSKRLAVNYLLTIEKVTEEDIRQNGVDLIIERYFYVESDLTFKNLIGIHFFNRALHFNKNNSNERALKYAHLANTYDKNDQSYFLKAGILTDLISETEHDDITNINYLTQYYNIENKPTRKDQIKSLFEYGIYSAFHKRDDIAFIDQSVELVNANIKDEASRNLFLSYIELERTEWLIDQAKYSKAHKSVIKGYQLDSTNKRFEKLIPFLIVNKLYDIEPDILEIDSIVEAKENEFPFLKNSYRFSKFCDAVIHLYSWRTIL